ncbi:BAG family molecular chaperone regulator 7-like [Phragmites australis]|uniref:BAG family molecular chaperone regulator 7-like n=1 Tax=Phragmites australis TaxID=29695 RepID=UPI002D772022|nr:BAG family molecular chaperone regulator 7-like [Phragmites australis]
MASHRHFLRLLDDPFFPFPPPPPTSPSCPFLPSPSPSCPFLDFNTHSFSASASPFHDLDLFLPAPPLDPFPAPSPYPFLLRDLTDRVAALEIAVAARRPADPEPTSRKYTYVTESAGRRVKWTAVEKPREGERALKWEADIKSPHDDGFDRKWNWEAKGATARSSASARKLKWGASVKGKGCLEPWSQAYTWEEDFAASDSDQEEEHIRKADKKKTRVTEKKKEDQVVKKEKKCPVASIKIQEISDNDAGCVAIRKAFAKGNGKGKRKELSPQDAALLIQMNYRAHLAHRTQVLCCLRDLAVAKAKLKEIRSLFYNISYRHRLAHDHEERQRFSEKIIVLLLTVDALEGPDYMVRTAKKSMLEELEAMLEVVDPHPPGKQRSLSRRKFDLPEGGAVSDEKTAGVNNAVRIIEEGK